ncbi:MAG TPA: CHASE domain-containing protein [Gammaproteobacteria bacterium]|nr:CHASE domain-containing protein [Gammaproteobacteria bacterium]
MKELHNFLRTFQSIIRYLLRASMLFFIYVLLAEISLKFTVPPGFSTSMWLPSGFALSFLFLWGVHYLPSFFLGHFFSNILLLDAEQSFTNIYILSFFLAAGGSIQCLIGYLIAHKKIKLPFYNNDWRAITFLLIIAGPLVCTTSPTVGTLSLYFMGLVEDKQLWINWLTWWVGDSLGVLVMTPFLLFILTHNKNFPWKKRFFIIFPLLVFFVCFLGMYLGSQKWFISHQEQRQDRYLMAINSAMQSQLDSYLFALFSLANYFKAEDEVTQNAFSVFARELMIRYPVIESLEWAPIVTHQQREAYERTLALRGIENPIIRERNEQRLLKPAQNREVYSPITYIESNQFKNMIGYDLFSEKQHEKIYEDALKWKKPVTKDRIVTHKHPSGVFVVLHPVFKKDVAVGFVIAAFATSKIFDQFLPLLSSTNITFKVTQNYETIFDNTGSDAYQNVIYRSLLLNVANRVWKVNYHYTLVSLLGSELWIYSTLLFLGLISICFLSIILSYTLVNYTLAENLVRELRLRTNALFRSNQALEDFAYIASHDLKEPLRGVSNFSQLLKEEYESILDSEALSYLERIKQLCLKMNNLITDLLNYSKLTYKFNPTELVDFNQLIHETFHYVHSLYPQETIKFSTVLLPKIVCDKIQMQQVFYNLMVNSIKYNDNRTKKITIGYFYQDFPTFFVKDNGIGIEEQHKEHVFKMFKRLHVSDYYGEGTGAGLSYVKRVIEMHGGKIWIENNKGSGITIYFTLQQEYYARQANKNTSSF